MTGLGQSPARATEHFLDVSFVRMCPLVFSKVEGYPLPCADRHAGPALLHWCLSLELDRVTRTMPCQSLRPRGLDTMVLSYATSTSRSDGMVFFSSGLAPCVDAKAKRSSRAQAAGFSMMSFPFPRIQRSRTTPPEDSGFRLFVQHFLPLLSHGFRPVRLLVLLLLLLPGLPLQRQDL